MHTHTAHDARVYLHTVDFRLLANVIEQFAHMIFKHDHLNAYVQCFNVLNNYLSMPLALSNDLRR